MAALAQVFSARKWRWETPVGVGFRAARVLNLAGCACMALGFACSFFAYIQFITSDLNARAAYDLTPDNAFEVSTIAQPMVMTDGS